MKNFEIPGFTKFESNIFKANGYETEEEVQRDFPDLYRKFYMPTFLSSMEKIEERSRLQELWRKLLKVYNRDYDTDGIMATTIIRAATETG